MTDSPFGSVKPENLPPPVPSVGKGAAKVKTSGRKRRASVREHYDRAIKIMEERLGGFWWPCDGKKIGYGGSLVSTDLLGFMDIQGVSKGWMYAANITSLEKVGAHLRDYTNPTKTHGAGKVPIEKLMRRYFKEEGRFFMIGYHQPGGKGTAWQYEVTEVTPELLDQYKARKRRTPVGGNVE